MQTSGPIQVLQEEWHTSTYWLRTRLANWWKEMYKLLWTQDVPANNKDTYIQVLQEEWQIWGIWGYVRLFKASCLCGAEHGEPQRMKSSSTP